ncbi:hypothetical protein JCGZ_01046 [Jatropha curcas]|uniref:DUF4408 domain-containing protein n=1 Tax=Jatropha curcas TaxID=180498 RepID=A0A067L5D4_JATCU|nr:uncharacterized protein LOC105633103 [Jatropha curcas]KDP39289.1 hypothetical protein JCGZ_01046 [Jatropha curcas]
MEQAEHKNLQTLSQFTRYQFLKNITQLLLSVSVFSLILSNSARLSFLHSFNFCFSTVPVQLFSHTIDKKCLFLICNGLLVFVAKFSGLVTTSDDNNNDNSSSKNYNSHNNSIGYSVKNYEDDEPPTLKLDSSKSPMLENTEDLMDQENVSAAAAEVETRENDKEIEEEKESEFLVQEDDGGQEEVKEFDDKFLIHEDYQEEEEEEDYEEEEENGMLSTEELNKKFEEFIRKMKEELRFEAQQQLIMVN